MQTWVAFRSDTPGRVSNEEEEGRGEKNRQEPSAAKKLFMNAADNF